MTDAGIRKSQPPSRKPLAPHDDRARVVTAPAGSGKTTLLLFHFLRHLKRGVPIERIAAITFTRKAAAELTERLAAALRWVLDPSSVPSGDRKYFGDVFGDVTPNPEQAEQALSALGAASVGTVDAFTQALVQEFLLHAVLELSDGTRVPIDGPVDLSTETEELYEQAARSALEGGGADAALVIREVGLGPAIRGVATLARSGVGAGVGASTASVASLLETLGKHLAPAVRRAPEAWLTAASDKFPDPDLQEKLEAWLHKPKGSPPPGILWLCGRLKDDDAAQARDDAMDHVLVALGLDAEDAIAIPWSTKFAAGFKPWIAPDAVADADALRAAFAHLAHATRDAALDSMARLRALGYAEMLEAATLLCSGGSGHPVPESLRNRYDVLMVDELQDTNPAQLAFYQAFRGLRPDLQGFFVGDARQSIYRFRHADPDGWTALLREAERDRTVAELTVNWRSSPLLVAAQREIFARLLQSGRHGVDALDHLQAAPGRRGGRLEEATPDAPVLVIDDENGPDANHAALAALATRLTQVWANAADASAPKSKRDTAAVLVMSWDRGVWASRVLAAYGIRSRVTGDQSLLRSRVAADLRLLLASVLDPSEEISLAGLLKHPTIGVSDRGLLRLRSGGSLARLFYDDGISDDGGTSELDPHDAQALVRALPVLRDARARIGRAPTAEVLEEVIARLHWRAAIAAGPEYAEGVGLAQLDILLEVVRQEEAGRVDPRASLGLIGHGYLEGVEELPVVQMAEEEGVVTIITYHSAKGLEFDHVALLDAGRDGSDGAVQGEGFRQLRIGGVPLLGVRMDPSGSLTRCRDPLAVIASALGGAESLAEGMRLFYVGFTRAARSVVVSVGRKRAQAGLVEALRPVLTTGEPIDGVLVTTPDDYELLAPLRCAAMSVEKRGELEARWSIPSGLRLASPSGAREQPGDWDAVAESFLARAQIVEGPSPPSLPVPPGAEDVGEAAWGDVVHGWLERWAFDGEPAVSQARDYLLAEWQEHDGPLAEWLVAVGLAVRDGLPGFRELLSHKLHFEWPILGVDGATLWQGRADLVVELPDKKVVVIDFKAGSDFARAGGGGGDGGEGDAKKPYIPHAKDYAAQLEAYRRVLVTAGYEVVEVGLVFVRGVSWVRGPG